MAWHRCTGNPGGSLKVRTASGAVTSFETNLAEPLQSVKCEINAKQDLHGEDKPYPAGGGVNLFDKANTFEGYIIDTNGNFSSRTGDVATDFISVVGNASYYVKSEQSSGMWGAWYNENKEYISACTGYANSVITAPTNAKFVRLTVVHNSGNPDTFAINYPATDTAYHPYENVCPIIGIDELNVQRTGANICGGETLADKFANSYNYNKSTVNKTFTFEYIPNNLDRTILKGVFKANTQYTFIFKYTSVGSNNSLRIYYTDNTVTSCQFNTNSNKTDLVVVSVEGKTISSVRLEYYSSNAVTVYYDESGVFEGVKTVDDFNAYSGKLIKLEFDDTVYLAEVSCLNGVWKLKLLGAEIDLGELDWTYNSTFAVFRGDITGCINSPAVNSEHIPMCSIYEGIKPNYATVIKNAQIMYNVGGAGVYVKDTSYTDASDFKTAMNGVQLVHELATPIEITLDETEQFEALLGVNNVWHDGNGNTEVKYLYNA